MEDFKKENNIKMLLEIANEEHMIPLLNDGSIHIQHFMNKVSSFIDREKNSRKTVKQLNIDFLQSLIQPQLLEKDRDREKEKEKEKEREREKEKKKRVDTMTEYIERAGRMPEWEQQVKKKELEFQSSFMRNLPQEPNFRENFDGPIQNMEHLIAQTIQNRNYEMNEIQKQLKKQVGSEEGAKGPGRGQTPIKYIEIGEEVAVKPDLIELDEDIMDDMDDMDTDHMENVGTVGTVHEETSKSSWRSKMENELNDIKCQLVDLSYMFRTFAITNGNPHFLENQQENKKETVRENEKEGNHEDYGN